jgi:hypothetical protein
MLCLVSSREDNFGQDEQQSTYHQSWMNKNTIIRKQNDCLSQISVDNKSWKKDINK